jgi:hypothetical protein
MRGKSKLREAGRLVIGGYAHVPRVIFFACDKWPFWNVLQFE